MIYALYKTIIIYPYMRYSPSKKGLRRFKRLLLQRIWLRVVTRAAVRHIAVTFPFRHQLLRGFRMFTSLLRFLLLSSKLTQSF